MSEPKARDVAPDRASEVRFEEDAEELYEDAPCGYLSTTPDGVIRRVNKTFLSWTGYDAVELIGRRRFYDLLPPGAKIYYETHYLPLLLMQGAVREIALEVVRADADRLPVLVNAATKVDSSGRPVFVRITVFDASDRRRYERELMHARAQAEARAAAATALEYVAEGVVLADADGRIRLLNPPAERMFGVVASEVTGLPLSALAAEWEDIAARIPVGFEAEFPVASVVLPLSLPEGPRWVAACGRHAPDGIVYTLRDVTEGRQIEDFRDDIVTIVSHELRTPLASVYGAAQTLVSLGKRITEDQRDQLIALIGEQSARLSRIVEEILLTRRLDAGEVALERQVFDVGKTVERVLAQARAWDTSPVSVEAPPRIHAEGDAAMFEQILINLIDNAVKYSPADAPVRVTVASVRASVRVSVADAGPGIPAVAHERIFEKFFRLDPGQLTGASGTGLGLYIARELVRRMRGTIGLLSPGDGGGATFYVDLPVARLTPTVHDERANGAEPPE